MAEKLPTPSDDEIVAAVAAMCEGRPAHETFSAKQIGTAMCLRGQERLGRKSSVGGNWSGKMSPALRVAAPLARLYREGRLHAQQEDYRWMYRLPQPGDRPYTPPPKRAKQPPVVRPRKPRNMLRGR